MSPVRHKTGNITEIRHPGFMKQALRQRLYLLEKKTLAVIKKIKKKDVSGIFVGQEKTRYNKLVSVL